MEQYRSYAQRGSPDCPIEVYSSFRGPHHKIFTHWHPELEVMFVERGFSVYRMDKDAVTVHEGDILVIPPGTIHGQQTYSQDISVWSIIIPEEAVAMPETHVFQQEFVLPLREGRLRMPTLLHPGDPAHTALLPHMSSLHRCKLFSPNYKLNRFTTAVNICATLLPFCEKAVDQAPVLTQNNRAVRECMRYIHRNYEQPLTLQTLADHVHLQPNYLCGLFKEHTGQTIIEHLTQIRIDAATFLLRNTDLPIARITELSGFHSQSVFFRRFQELMKTTPKAYRKQQTTQTIE